MEVCLSEYTPVSVDCGTVERLAGKASLKARADARDKNHENCADVPGPLTRRLSGQKHCGWLILTGGDSTRQVSGRS